ncbi:hypothetical protein RRG08_024392 [Elysia crispata]|uniref:Uncharacterized protein n=1 Tax=Elysia crispata TaxID=231223 RepID=A0AAE0YP07_9GAST|nr:hypothetical protein RRG08_024392 [Elysia crispata]
MGFRRTSSENYFAAGNLKGHEATGTRRNSSHKQRSKLKSSKNNCYLRPRPGKGNSMDLDISHGQLDHLVTRVKLEAVIRDNQLASVPVLRSIGSPSAAP